MGLAERVAQYGYQLWQAILAVVLMREGRQMMFPPSAFKTAEVKPRILAAYDAEMKLWPVPYEEIDVRVGLGRRTWSSADRRTAPPLVLLHGYMATLTMWSPNIAAFSKDYRVYAIDVMGQPSKSLPDEPIRKYGGFRVVADGDAGRPGPRSRLLSSACPLAAGWRSITRSLHRSGFGSSCFCRPADCCRWSDSSPCAEC